MESVDLSLSTCLLPPIRSVSLMWLQAEPTERARLPQPGTPEWTLFLAEVMEEAFSALRKVNVTLRWRTVQGQGKVTKESITSIHPAGHPLRRAHWHSRSSLHFPKELGLGFEAFEEGLLRHHTQHEQQYIEALEHAECLEVLVPQVAEIWHMKYRTPSVTANRDFVELVLMLPMPTDENPFNVFHEQETIKALKAGTLSLDTRSIPRGPPGTYRSFLVISMPISHAATPNYVRGYYASVEGVREDWTIFRPGEVGVQWMLTTQAEAGGSIPRWLQELSMPSQIAADVPAFLEWAKLKKA